MLLYYNAQTFMKLIQTNEQEKKKRTAQYIWASNNNIGIQKIQSWRLLKDTMINVLGKIFLLKWSRSIQFSYSYYTKINDLCVGTKIKFIFFYFVRKLKNENKKEKTCSPEAQSALFDGYLSVYCNYKIYKTQVEVRRRRRRKWRDEEGFFVCGLM